MTTEKKPKSAAKPKKPSKPKKEVKPPDLAPPTELAVELGVEGEAQIVEKTVNLNLRKLLLADNIAKGVATFLKDGGKFNCPDMQDKMLHLCGNYQDMSHEPEQEQE